MKKILCFGDSNTYGFDPNRRSRYGIGTRWSGRLSLKGIYNLKEAGCNNRTAFSDNPAGLNFTGYKILPEYLLNDTFDFIVVQIGINDLQKSYNVSLADFENGIGKFFRLIKYYAPSSQVIILAPCIIKPNVLNSYFNLFFDEESIEKSKHILPAYQKAAKENDYILLDLNEFTTTSNIDGLHYEPYQHKKIYQEVMKLINQEN